MRTRLTWTHFHSPLQWSPVVKKRRRRRRKNWQGYLKRQCVARLKHLTWEKNLPVPYLGPTVTDWTTLAKSTPCYKKKKNCPWRGFNMFFSPRIYPVVYSLKLNAHTGVQREPGLMPWLKLLPPRQSGTVRKQVQQSASPMEISLLSPRKEKTATATFDHVLPSCAPRIPHVPLSSFSKFAQNFTHLSLFQND